jgi:osmoprotectant transport system permease protein
VKPTLAAILFAMLAGQAALSSAEPVLIGSKRFTESYVLGELAKRALEQAGVAVEHRPGMGGTIVLWEALRTGAITAYPEYTGTIREEILKQSRPASPAALRVALARHGVGLTDELGFNNTYALVMKRDRAEALGVRTISDLARHPDLTFGLTHEFLGRQDGWQPLRQRYRLSAEGVSGIEHSLGYGALLHGETDVKDAYSTDAKIAENDLVVLIDDQQFFPEYKAVFLHRLDAPQAVVATLEGLAGTIDEKRMIRMNAEAERTKDYAAAAALYFGAAGGTTKDKAAGLFRSHDLLRWTTRHLALVGISLAAAVLMGIPLGIRASRPGMVSQAILGVTGVIQTVPSLALLALLVPLPFLGVSPLTAIVALFLYSLLPIVRNTAAGLQAIPVPLRESAAVLGLNPRSQLLKIYLPMASPLILAGIKTSAVINVGSATLAALIGAGGLGEPIISGLNLNDHATILQGAIPAAALAIAIQVLFSVIERWMVPRGLRLKTQ